jgi:predicted membrane-bound mannosyltransferase
LPRTTSKQITTQPGFLDRPLTQLWPALNVRRIISALILILAVISRFYILDLRVMSHDEVNHVVPSYDLYTGKGYRHDPVNHGPMQFHLVAASYFMMGDSDFSSRVPAALFSIAAIAFISFTSLASWVKWGIDRRLPVPSLTLHAVLWTIHTQ